MFGAGVLSAELRDLLVATLRARGSDLHLSSRVLPMVRIDGDLRPMTVRGPFTPDALEGLLLPLLPERLRAGFAERRDADFGFEVEGVARFRANVFVDRQGIGAVFRVVPSQIVPAERLGFPQEVLRLCQQPKGLVLVTGPTGSGKSTTLASLVDHVNRTRSAHIVTIEDPIEYVFENKRCLVNQREVGLHTRSFAAALRAALREDPDVLLVGELRDLETMEMALETAEAGHLVFATLHANSAHTAIDRMIDVFPADRQPQIRVMLASSLRGVIAQMLCRRKAGGRVAAYEVLFGVPSVAHLIREGKAHQIPSVMQTGAKLGMRLMNDSLLELVRRGLVAPDEALARSNDRAALQAALRELSPDGA
ncbi:MAG: PilT/PilU family type 4a pilus ATPase [Deltaproteobacteria bacterium]|nr:PilT/PilU family type 4a pilus ATPase [Deltaproteobacteria bacterium]